MRPQFGRSAQQGLRQGGTQSHNILPSDTMAVTTRVRYDIFDRVKSNRTVVLFGVMPCARLIPFPTATTIIHTVQSEQFPTRAQLVEVLDRGQVSPDGRLLVVIHKPPRHLNSINPGLSGYPAVYCMYVLVSTAPLPIKTPFARCTPLPSRIGSNERPRQPRVHSCEHACDQTGPVGIKYPPGLPAGGMKLI